MQDLTILDMVIPMDSQEQQEQQVPLEARVQRALRVLQDWVVPGHLVSLVRLVRLVLLVGLQATLERQVKLVQAVVPELQD
jgi:hypothetical protein